MWSTSGLDSECTPFRWLRPGCPWLAIDSSALLLRTLRVLRERAPVRLVCDDLLAFPAYLQEPPDAILCMGDTIVHLPDVGSVAILVGSAAAALKRGGAFVVSLRDFSVPLLGDQRFIPVRSDDTRLATCFLEFEPTHVVVHDILHERTSNAGSHDQPLPQAAPGAGNTWPI